MFAGLDLARDVIGRLGRACHILTGQEGKPELALGCEVARETLLRGAHDFVSSAGRR